MSERALLPWLLSTWQNVCRHRVWKDKSDSTNKFGCVISLTMPVTKKWKEANLPTRTFESTLEASPQTDSTVSKLKGIYSSISHPFNLNDWDIRMIETQGTNSNRSVAVISFVAPASALCRLQPLVVCAMSSNMECGLFCAVQSSFKMIANAAKTFTCKHGWKSWAKNALGRVAVFMFIVFMFTVR